jgi:hypothetical protein
VKFLQQYTKEGSTDVSFLWYIFVTVLPAGDIIGQSM